MHFYALIPVVAILVSAAFGAVAVAWNSDRRATAPMCAIFACTGVWAFLDLMTFLEQAALAVDAMRLSPKFRREVAKREARRLLQDESSPAVLAEIEKEIDAADLDPMGFPFDGGGADDDDDDDDDPPS